MATGTLERPPITLPEEQSGVGFARGTSPVPQPRELSPEESFAFSDNQTMEVLKIPRKS